MAMEQTIADLQVSTVYANNFNVYGILVIMLYRDNAQHKLSHIHARY